MDMSKIAEVVTRARELGFLELYSTSELVNAVLSSSGETNAILYRPNIPPALFNAAVEEDYVALAVLDLNLSDEVPIGSMRRIKDEFNNLEDVTTRLSYESGSETTIPFLFPLYLDEDKDIMGVALGLKTAVQRDLFNEGFVEGLLENLDMNYEAYLNKLLTALTKHYSTSP